MTPFLNIQMQWSRLRSSLLSAFRPSRRTETEGTGRGFHEIDSTEGQKGGFRGVSGLTTDVLARVRFSTNGSLDQGRDPVACDWCET